MKRKSLLFLLLMALFAPLAMNAQSRSTLTVYGDNTTTNEYVPIYGFYCDEKSKCEFIIPAEKLSAMNGGIVSDMKFYLSSSNSSNDISATFNVFVKEVNTTTLTGFTGTTNATSVYTSTISIPKSQSNIVLDIPFSSNYIYGGGNLLIGVYQTGNSSYNHTYWTGESQSGNTAWQGYGSECGNGRSFLPKTTFTYEISTTPSINLPATATVLTGFTTTLTATTLNVTGTPTITYSSSNTNVATVSGSGTTATVTGVSAGSATITATMTVNGTNYTATCAVTVEDPSYCTPAPTSVDGSGITNVTFGTGMVVNDNFTMNSSPYYYDHSNMIGGTAPGSTVEMSIAYATNYTYYTWVWVDWNKNYEFDEDELVYPSSQTISSGTLSLQFNVPSSVTPDDYRMRIQGADNSSKKDPCYTGSYSYLIDYTLRVSSDPTIGLTPATATVITGSTETLTAIVANVTGTPTITYSSSNTSIATVTGTGTTATVTGMAEGTATITASMTYQGTTYTAECAITVVDACQPTWTGNDYYISNFSVSKSGTTLLNNSSTGTGGTTTNYYATQSITAEPGDELSCVITMYSSSSYSTYGFAMWVDFDQNGLDSNDLITSTSGYSNSPYTITLNIPTNASSGEYRMRIWGDYNNNSASDPCGPFKNGEAEDYKLIVAGGAYTITCATPDHGTLSADKNSADENDVITITATPETDYLLTALTYTPEGGTAQNINIASMPYTFTMPAANVTVNATFTLPTCPKPTNVTANNVTVNSAHISWNGEADSYNVQYATATVTGTTLETVFFDDFENGFGNWTTYALGDYTDDTWALTNSTSLVDNYHSGSYGALTRSYYNGVDVSVDNWLVSPQMTLGDVLKFWVVGDNNNYQEYFAVYVSTETNAASDFVMLEAPELAPGDGTWAERTVDLSAYAGQVGYIAIRHTDFAQDFLILDDFGVYRTVNAYSYGTFTTLPPTTETSSNITGLSPETLYVAQVQADCGGTDGTSSWSSVYFTTPDACSAPTDLVTSNITATTATLGWSDNQDSYNVQYRKVYFFEGFEGETLPTGWTTIDANEDGNTWGIFHVTTHSGNNGAANLSYIYNVTGTQPDDYLISPQLDLQGTLRVWLSGITASTYAEHFEILLSTTGNSASDFTTTLVAEAVTTNEYVEYTADLSSYVGQQGYIAIHHFNCTDQRYLYVDDFGIYGSENWVSVNPNPTDATTTLNDLQPNTGYEWQVQGIDCDGNGGTTNWSAPATFTTPEGYVKEIKGYGTGTGNWYLISSPIGSISNSDLEEKVINIFSNSYDLFYFDQAKENEWVNYKPNESGTSTNPHFGLEKGKGYLYANSNDVDLVFTGQAHNTEDMEIELNLTETASGYTIDLPGWNLVGNPYAELAYIDIVSEERPFYTMNGGGTAFEAATNGSIDPMEGVFVIAEEDGETMTFSTTEPTSKGKGLALNLSDGHNRIDRAIVRFNKGRTLPKLMLFKNSTKVYIPMDGQDYAVVRSEEVGEMPVNFKAENNGSYTLSLSVDNVEFGYLHLIDNMTGMDIDLLQTPSYTFEAKTTDYESRFKLVFATGDNSKDDNFAYFSNGSFVINNDGKATLQVIDIMGRILKSENINGCANLNVNAAPGIYMLRLVNGDNVKVQKVVVK